MSLPVQQNYLAPSFSRFDAQVIQERPWCSIQDRVVEPGPLLDLLAGHLSRPLDAGGHISDRQVLGHDQMVLANELGRGCDSCAS